MNIILIVENNEEVTDIYCSTARKAVATQAIECEIHTAATKELAIAKITTTTFDLVVTDMRMGPGKLEGLDVLRAAKKKDQTTQVIVVTAFGTAELGEEVMELGAFDYLQRNPGGIEFFKILPYKIRLALRFRQALMAQGSGQAAG